MSRDTEPAIRPGTPGLNFDTTIAAVASGVPSAISIIRISGPNAHSVLDKVVIRKSKSSSAEPLSWRKLLLCSVIDPQTNRVVDEPLCAFFRAPYSYTGEDMVEMFCHGGPYIVSKVLEILYAQGIEAAKAGEFTYRAYLNGKMDLTQAEGVRALTQAQTTHQWAAAKQLYGGRLSTLIADLRNHLISACAFLNARIDFPEEGDVKIELDQAVELVRKVQHSINDLTASYDKGRISTQGLRVALIGQPNVGKSTLLNTILRCERAIVTDIAGTTRDYIEETCLIKGRLIRIIDTAGIREADNIVEKMGVEKSLKLASQSDLVLLISSADIAPTPEWQQISAEIERSVDVIKIVSKADLPLPSWVSNGYLPLSCKSGHNLGRLEDALVEKIDSCVLKNEEDVCITSTRHLHALTVASNCLEKFFVARGEGLYDECLMFELEQALKALSEVIGHVDAEDIFDKIFSEFCIGK